MKKFFTLLLYIFCTSHLLYAENNWLSDKSKPDSSVTLLFAGDMMGHSPQFKVAYNSFTKKYNYNPCFQFIKPYLKDCDYSIANLEVTLSGPPYSGYPEFSSPDALLIALKKAGFNVIAIANNHIADKGEEGLNRTVNTLIEHKVKFTGAYLDKTQRDSLYPLLLKKDGFKIALFNYTYGTNKDNRFDSAIVNLIDTTKILEDIRKSEIEKADFKIAFLHWGTEYEPFSSNYQRKIADFLCRSGIDCIIGSHPHVVEEADFKKCGDRTVPVFYSLGNAISNQRKPGTYGGIFLKIKIDIPTKRIISCSYIPNYVYRGYLKHKYQYYIIPTTDFIKKPGKYKLPKNDSINLVDFDHQTRIKLSNVHILKN